MSSCLKVKHIVGSSGERLKVVVDSFSGVPLYYPNLYITSQVRGSSKSVASILSFISAMKVLFSWCSEYSVDLEERWVRGKWLTLWEIDSLRDFCSLNQRELETRSSKVRALRSGIRASEAMVGGPTKYVRMTFIAEYLKWLASVMGAGRNCKDSSSEIVAMYRRIRSGRPKTKSRSDIPREDKGLDPHLLSEIMDVVKPGHTENPYIGYPLQARNACMIALLYYLGVRRGELLNLKVDDINFVANEVRIIRRADSSEDDRVYQPLVKTEERILPISNELTQKLSHYVTAIRSKFLVARRHPYLFVTHKEGPYQGKPLSNSGFGKMMSTLQGIAESFSQVHAHAFRHSWNYGFSIAIDSSKSEISLGKEEQMRSYLMGWKEASGTAAIYNRRHTREKAKEAILEYQNRIVSEGKLDD